MKQFWIGILMLMVSVGTASAQAENYAKPHKIVVQLQSGDTMAHKSLMNQLGNMISVSPKSKIEVVCHGPGIQLLMLEKNAQADKVKGLAGKGISFVACEYTMEQKKITKEQLIPEAGTVKYGVLQVVTRQEKGWSYIKGGF